MVNLNQQQVTMIALLIRTYEKDITKGSLLIYNGEQKLLAVKTLELPDNGNQENISCIPEGTYQVTRKNDEKRGIVFKVLDVKDRFGILIHKGNYTRDTRGCIIPGNYFVDLDENGTIDIAESTSAMEKLVSTLPEIFKLIILS